VIVFRQTSTNINERGIEIAAEMRESKRERDEIELEKIKRKKMREGARGLRELRAKEEEKIRKTHVTCL